MSSKLRKLKTTKAFDITHYLYSEEAMAEYLSQVLKDGDSTEFIRALSHIARAKDLMRFQK
jgi:probable addiction module antidote protein